MDIAKQLRKMNTIGNVMIRKFSFCTDEVKKELFRAHCSSVYCCALWSSFRKASLSKLRVCHNSILRRLLGIPRMYSASLMFVQSRLNNLDVLLRTAMYSIKSRLLQSDNDLIKGVINSHAFISSDLNDAFRKELHRAQQ